MNMGEAIKSARKKAGLTQKELGKRMGVSGTMVAMYETNQRNPKRETINKIAEALGISKYDLLSAEDNDVYFYTETFSDIVNSLGNGFDMIKDTKEDGSKNLTSKDYYFLVVQGIMSSGVKAGFISETQRTIYTASGFLNQIGQDIALKYIFDLIESKKYTRGSEK